MYRIYIIILILSVNKVFCQTQGQNTIDFFQYITKSSKGEGTITINQEESVRQLFNLYVDYQINNKKIPGYRIRIYSNSGQSARSKAYQERSKFEQFFPEYPSYLEYETPNYKVYIGDFRTKTDAFNAYQKISKVFYNAFIVPSYINLPKLD